MVNHRHAGVDGPHHHLGGRVSGQQGIMGHHGGTTVVYHSVWDGLMQFSSLVFSCLLFVCFFSVLVVCVICSLCEKCVWV